MFNNKINALKIYQNYRMIKYIILYDIINKLKKNIYL